MSRHMIVLLASTALATTAAMAQQQRPATPPQPQGQQAQTQGQPMNTADFVRQAAIGNMFEIESSQLALQRSQDDGVREFAQRMVNDHNMVATRMRALGQGQAPNALDQQHQQMMQQLSQANGPAFQRTYVQMQVQAHQQAVNMYQSYAQSGTDQNVRRFAQETLPALQTHLQLAQQLQQRAGTPDQMGSAQPNQQQGQQAEGSRITVQQGSPTIRVDQAAPQVTVRQGQPEIVVRQGQPTVQVTIPQPEIVVRMPQPDVNVATAQPQVQIQRSGQPQVQVQRDQAQVQVQQAQRPVVRYEPAPEPRVVVNRQGEPNVRYEQIGQADQQQPQQGTQAQVTTTQRGTATQQQAGQTRQQAQISEDQRRQVRERIGTTQTGTATTATNAANLRAVRIVDLSDLDVYNMRGQRLGEVERIVTGPNNRQHVVISSGGFLGIGEDHVAFPLERFWMQGDRLLIEGVTDDDIDNMADFRNDAVTYRNVPATTQARIRVRE